MKKKLSMVIALFMLASTVGCSSANVTSSTAGTSDDALDFNYVTTDENGYTLRGYDLPIVDEPLTLTMFAKTDVKWSATKTAISELDAYQIIMEKTGINVEFTHPVAGEETEQLNLLMASNDLPDMVFYPWRSISGGPAKYIAENQIIKLNDYLEKYAPNYMAYMEQYPSAYKDAVLDDGSHYMFDMLRVNEATGGWFILNGIVEREDWLKKLGLETPTTLEEFEACLYAIRDGDPNGNGQADEIPFCFHKDNVGTFATWFSVLDTYYLDGNTIKYGPIEDGYKQYLQLLNKWYNDGLVDAEYLLNDTATLNNKIASERVGFSYGALAGGMGTWTNMLAETNPDAVITAVPYFPSKTDDTPYLSYKVKESATSSGVAISANCKHIKEAVMFRDFFYSEQGTLISNFGREGDSFTFVDGVPTFTDNVLKNNKGLTTTQALSQYVLSASDDAMVKTDDYFKQVTLLLDNQRASQDIWAPAQDSLVINGGVSLTTEESTEYAELNSTISTYVSEMEAKFITGQESFDNWDAYVQTVKNYQIDRCLEIRQAAYDRYLKR